MRSRSSLKKLLILTALFLSACTAAVTPTTEGPSAADINAAAEQAATAEPPSQPTETSPPDTSATETSPPTTEEPTPIPTEEGSKTNPRVQVPADLSVAWLIPWDGIRPIYDPEFASAAEAPLDDEELVLAISLDGEAKAYPISVLQSREMVNDELAGIPILATW
jgi:hypothetical protein